MKRLILHLRFSAGVALLPLIFVQQSLAWGHDGHSIINRIAAEKLPPDVPKFLRSKYAFDALAYYAPQPDTWRAEDRSLYSSFVPEHDIDLEIADLAGPLPRTRYEYIQALNAAQAKHPDVKLGPGNVGLLPYSGDETYTMLKSAFRDYRNAVQAKKDTRIIQAQILFLVGFLGHYVGDASQPLHATINYNGWTTGPNPPSFPNDHTIHARFEGDYVHNNVKASDVEPLVNSKPVVMNDVFVDFLAFIRQTNSFVEPLYQLDQSGAFTGAGTPQGKAFTDQRLAAGATELRDMIYTAWIKSADPIPVYKGN
jgi:hypothetical protein